MKVWWKKFRSLSCLDKWLLIKATWNLIHLTLALQILPFHLFKKYYKAIPSFNVKENRIQKYVIAIKRATNLSPSYFTCLPRAWVLKKATKKSKLIIGIMPSQSINLDAHAWVEKDNEILIGEMPNFEYMPLWVWD
jgi:hypothetical protein